MNPIQRTFPGRVLATIVVALSALLTGIADAAYPERPITLVVPFGPGGSTDQAARILAQKLSESLGQSVVVENRVGAGGRIGTASVAKAKPDGYTLLVSGVSTLVVPTAIPPALTFDPKADLVPVGMYAMLPTMLAGAPNLPAKDFREAVALFKANPGKYAYGSAGVGSQAHYAPHVIFNMLGADLTHVPYKGTGGALPDLLAGRISIVFDAVSTFAPLIKEGRVKGLVVLQKDRAAQLPDVPSAGETFPEILKYTWTAWAVITMPSGTPEPIQEMLNNAITRAARDPDVVKRFTELGLIPRTMPLREVRQFIDREFAAWPPVLKAMNIKAE